MKPSTFGLKTLPFAALLGVLSSATSAPLPVVSDVEWQPLAAQVRRVFEALDYIGSPVDPTTKSKFESLLKQTRSEQALAEVQKLLDPLCLLGVQINPESRVKVSRGEMPAELVEQGWTHFLVKVQNEAGVTARLEAESPNAPRLAGSSADQVLDRWLDLAMFDEAPMEKTLSGLKLEYRIIALYSRDAGKREAKMALHVGQGTQDVGFRNEVPVLFNCRAAQTLTFRVTDEHGKPTTGCFTVRDKLRRVYPSTNKRLAPDFAFHPQIYRADGETLKLPNGNYEVEFSRGPESIVEKRPLEIKGSQTAKFQVKRWVDPASLGWWSGDHHIHAAGCAHYNKPTEGVRAEDMIRHCLGEDLKVGCNLTWGPCFDFQKQFFSGKVDKVSKYPYLIRYDIEVSGFGSHQSGHLCLLRLKEQMYPGGDSKDHWPTLGLNTLRWAKKQGAVTGPAHSGSGLKMEGDAIPNYAIPPYDGIGANEFIVDITHQVPGPDGKLVPAIDFISLVDTACPWELTMWYHSLNAGFRVRGSGETDFPCISGERVGMGRSYVKLGEKLDFDLWCEGIRQGRSYVSDGKSHLLEFRINDTAVGEKESELKLAQPGTVRVNAKVAAWLDENPTLDIKKVYSWQKQAGYLPWHIERARIGDSRQVPLELIVNGKPMATNNILADGSMRDIAFDAKIDRSSWVALRILASSHSNPIWVLVDGKPLAPDRRSTEWCLKGVDQCWSQKKRFDKSEEMQDAEKAYEHARTVYRGLLTRAVD